MGNGTMNCKCNCNNSHGASFSFDNETPEILQVIPKLSKTQGENSRSIVTNTRKNSLEKLLFNTPKELLYTKKKTEKTNEAESYSPKKTYKIDDAGQKIKSHIFIRNSLMNNNCYDYESISIIKIQSLFKGYLLRKKYIDKIKNELIIHENSLINEINLTFHSSKLKIAESLFGTFDKDSWKLFYKDGDFLFSNINEDKERKDGNIENFIFHAPKEEEFGNIYFCNIKINSLLYKTIYKGYETVDGERQGYGIFLQSNGAKIEGYWKEGIINGWGRITDSEGTILEGYFINGKINGKGTKKTLDGLVYIGEFYQGLRKGIGNEETKNTLYEGEFDQDEKHGKGKLEFKTLNEKYEGEFKNNSINGYGIYYWNNGNIYKGTFINGKMDGTGLFIWSDGNRYYGEYKDNIKEGKGKFTWKNGKSFEGIFKNGKPHGKGIMKVADKDKSKNKSFLVEFCNGKLMKK